MTTAPVDEQRFSRYQQTLSASGTGFHCSDLKNLPAGKLLIETVHAQSTQPLHTYLEVPVVGVSDAPVYVPLTLNASGEEYLGTLETGLVVHDGAAGLSTHEMFRSDAGPLKLCVQDESSSGAVGSGWIFSGRVLP